MQTIYRTEVNDDRVYEGEDKEAAIRAWDAATYNQPFARGGIGVQSFKNFIMVRDGWLLHVSDKGHVYLNPRV
jgi:hypothetical protein